jgi:hypothetical protein
MHVHTHFGVMVFRKRENWSLKNGVLLQVQLPADAEYGCATTTLSGLK